MKEDVTSDNPLLMRAIISTVFEQRMVARPKRDWVLIISVPYTLLLLKIRF